MSTLTPFDLAALTLAGLASLGLLVTLAVSWIFCKRQKERPSHIRDSADYKRGV